MDGLSFQVLDGSNVPIDIESHQGAFRNAWYEASWCHSGSSTAVHKKKKFKFDSKLKLPALKVERAWAVFAVYGISLADLIVSFTDLLI